LLGTADPLQHAAEEHEQLAFAGPELREPVEGLRELVRLPRVVEGEHEVALGFDALGGDARRLAEGRARLVPPSGAGERLPQPEARAQETGLDPERVTVGVDGPPAPAQEFEGPTESLVGSRGEGEGAHARTGLLRRGP